VLLLNEGLTRVNPDPDKLTGQCQVEVFIGGLQNEVPHRQMLCVVDMVSWFKYLWPAVIALQRLT
jgi:hypothetical protein